MSGFFADLEYTDSEHHARGANGVFGELHRGMECIRLGGGGRGGGGKMVPDTGGVYSCSLFLCAELKEDIETSTFPHCF